MEWVGVCSSDLGGGEGGSVGAVQWREMGTPCWEGEQSFRPSTCSLPALTHCLSQVPVSGFCSAHQRLSLSLWSGV